MNSDNSTQLEATEGSSSSSSSSSSLPLSPANLDYLPTSPHPGFGGEPHEMLMTDCLQVTAPPAPPIYAKQIDGAVALAQDGTLTGQGVLALFHQTGNMMMGLQQAAQQLNTTVTGVKTEVTQLRTDFQDKYSALKHEVTTIQKSQESWVIAIARNAVNRSVLYCLGTYGFCTASGFVCGIPYFSTEDANCDAPELMVGIHIGLATVLVRRWFKDIHNKINVQTVLGALSHLFDNRDVPDEDVIRLNKVAACRIKVDPEDGAYLDKDLKSRKYWLHVRASMLLKALLHLDEQFRKRTFERPLRRATGDEAKMTEQKVAEDIIKSINSRSPASRDSLYNGQSHKMAFGIPCWKECLDSHAWIAFTRLMQPWIVCNLQKADNVDSAQRFFAQPDVPLRLLRSFCTPVTLPIKSYVETQNAYPKVEEKSKGGKKAGGRDKKKKTPKQPEVTVTPTKVPEEEEDDDDDDEEDDSDAASEIDIHAAPVRGMGKGEHAELLRRQAEAAQKEKAAAEEETKEPEKEAEEAEEAEEEEEEEETVKKSSKKRKSAANAKSSAAKRRRRA